jgi:hypothetical protein
MKKLLPVLFFVCLGMQGFAQYDETEVADSLAKRLAKRAELGRFAITIGGGLSWRVAQLPDDQNELTKAYYKDLISGNGIDAGMTYYFSKRFGVGLHYNSFFSKAKIEDVVVTINGVNKFGDVEDKLAINFYAATFGGRLVNRTKTGYFFFRAAVGYLTYRDDAVAADVKQIIKGDTLGLMVSAGYTVMVSRNIGLGIGFNYLNGALSKFTITQDGHTTSQRLPENQMEGLQHFDFKLELDFVF